MTLQAGTPIGKYVVRRKLAEGGMAEIYLAASHGPEGFEKEVVIKRIRAFLATDPGFVQMFIAEARLASRLNHANLVQIFDFDKHEDTYYLAMEYVRGHSLWDARRRAKEVMAPMQPMLVAHICSEVARGLHYAHGLTDKGKPLNLVHRDVTPHNVLLSYDGAVKLTDFGVAKAGSRQTAAGVLKGKFAYMSPEQARGEEVDARTDVFALGIVLWEMLTGVRLFEGDSDVSVLRAVQQSVIPPPARLNPAVPVELDAISMHALDRDPAARYQTAYELERALAGFVLVTARSLDDADAGAYLRKLYPEEQAPEGVGLREEAPRPPPPPPPVTEPARASGARATSVVTSALSPDEDVHASTFVVGHGAGARGRGGEPPPVRRQVARIPMTLGMRRGLAGSAAVFIIVAAAAVVISLGRPARPALDGAPPAPAPLERGQLPGAALVPPPVAPAAPPAPAPVAAESAPKPAVQVIEVGAPAPVGGEPAAKSPAPVGTAASPPAPATPPAAARAAATPGTLVLQVAPWAVVTIDGKSLGEVSGRRSLKLPAGPHRVRLQHPKSSRDTTISIESGKSRVLEFDALEAP